MRYSAACNGHSPPTPLRRWTPRSAKRRPEPVTRSFSVPETSTSPAFAAAATRAPMCTAMPLTSSPRSSHSPVCRPVRISRPSGRTASRMASAQRTAPAGPRALAEGRRTPHRACGPVEGREEAVARRVNLPAAEAAQLLAYGGVVPLEQGAPGAVAEPGGVLRGAHDVGEQHRGQHAVVVDHRARPGEELLDR